MTNISKANKNSKSWGSIQSQVLSQISLCTTSLSPFHSLLLWGVINFIAPLEWLLEWFCFNKQSCSKRLCPNCLVQCIVSQNFSNLYPLLPPPLICSRTQKNRKFAFTRKPGTLASIGCVAVSLELWNLN